MTTHVLLDNQAVQAVADTAHPQHRALMAHVEASLDRRDPRTTRPRLRVPTTVRVEAGVDRTQPSSAPFNQLRIIDHPLDGHAADTAASIRRRHGVGPADAHLAALAHALPTDDRIVVLTNDPDDIRRATAPRSVDVRTV